MICFDCVVQDGRINGSTGNDTFGLETICPKNSSCTERWRCSWRENSPTVTIRISKNSRTFKCFEKKGTGCRCSVLRNRFWRALFCFSCKNVILHLLIIRFSHSCSNTETIRTVFSFRTFRYVFMQSLIVIPWKDFLSFIHSFKSVAHALFMDSISEKNYSYMISSSLLVLYFLPLLIGKLKKGSSIRLDLLLKSCLCFVAFLRNNLKIAFQEMHLLTAKIW